MSNIEPYKIIGTEIANLEVGSISKPVFYKITSGQRQKKSLLFHGKIGEKYYVYQFRTINRKTATLECAVKGCFAKSYVIIQSDLVKTIENGKVRSDGRRRAIYKVDYSDPKMRDLSSYTFIEKSTPDHRCAAQPETGSKGLFNAVKKDLREQIGLLSVASGRSEVETVIRAMQIRAQYGCGAQSQIVGKKSNEHKSAHRKIARSRGYENLDAYAVPREFHEICYTDYENLGQPKGIQFYQGNSENCEYFFLESELNFLQNLNIFLDGTFMLVNVIHSQVYIISINVTNLARFRFFRNQHSKTTVC